MSEVKDARDSSGDVSGRGAHDLGDAGAEELSGYLCGVCEEPLPHGASACGACGTPVAPLEDDEMVAGPYVIGEQDEAPAPDPYAPPPPEWSTPAGSGDPAVPIAAPAGAGAGEDGLPPPPPSFAETYDAAPVADVPSGNGQDLSPGPVTTAEPGHPGQDDPADLIGVERPTYPRPAVTDPGPDPMLGWAPTSPVMTPPGGDDDALLQRLDAADRRTERSGSGSGSKVAVIAGLLVVLLVAGAIGAVALTRNGDSGNAAPNTTAAPAPAPPPQVRNNVTTAPAPTTTATPDAPPDVGLFCTAALQFRLDPDPDSVAAKLVANPGQLVATVDLLMYNAPEDAKAAIVPMKDAVHQLAARISTGEIRTAADVRNAVGPTGAPMWPRFDQVLNPLAAKACVGR